MEHFQSKESARDSMLGRVMVNKVLTDFDRKILFTEGLSVNPNTPFSKAQEFALKKVRRKLKNKISAQESRRKKKEYLEHLEKRVRMLDVENNLMRKRLESQDETLRTLSFQMHKLKSPVEYTKEKNCQSRGTQTGICLKCHLQKQAVANDAKDDFKVQTGRNGRIVVHLDSLEEQEKPRSYSKSEYTDLRSIMYNQAHHRHDSTWLVENGKFPA